MTQNQQTQILSDVQQNHHRFGPNRPSNVQIQPSIQLGSSSTSQKIYSQNAPPIFRPKQTPNNNFQFPPQQTTNPRQQTQPIFGPQVNRKLQNLNNNHYNFQHHTQTNFIPNFSKQIPTDQRQPTPNIQHQRSVQNQLQQTQFFDNNLTQNGPPAFNSIYQQTTLAPPPQFQFQPPQPQHQQQQQLRFQQQFPQNQFPPQQQFNQFNQAQNFPPHSQPQSPLRDQEFLLQRDIEEEQRKIKDLQERQKIVQKHELFLQKQYQKQQAKVHQLHQEFLKKQKPETLPTPSAQTSTRGRTVLPSERTIFEQADFSSINPGDLDFLLKNHKEELLKQFDIQRVESKPTKARSKAKTTKALGRDDLLKQLKLALAEAPPADLGDNKFSEMDLVLPNGEKVQVIRTSDPEIIKRANVNSEAVFTQQLAPPTSAKPLTIEDIAKSGLLPPGANFELIKQTDNGNVEKVVKIPPQKKITFVYLEEQDDGSYKVQGVKSNNDKEAKTSGVEVDSIIKRIQSGDIQLPPPSSYNRDKVETPVPPTVPTTSTTTTTTPRPTTTTTRTTTTTTTTPRPTTTTTTTERTTTTTTTTTTEAPKPIPTMRVSVIPHSEPLDDDRRPIFINSNSIARSSSSAPITTIYAESASTPSPNTISSYTPNPYSTTRYTTASSIFQNDNTAYQFGISTTTEAPLPESTVEDKAPIFASAPSEQFPVTSDNIVPTESNDLSVILKKHGLFAMAKYLKQSGLDTILNETGPYTIFVPTDKAFKSLLVQLGGPDKAEEKFKNNPRLLSGVI